MPGFYSARPVNKDLHHAEDTGAGTGTGILDQNKAEIFKAHNLKVIGSNPIPATITPEKIKLFRVFCEKHS